MTTTRAAVTPRTAETAIATHPTPGPYAPSLRDLDGRDPVRIGVLGCGPIAQHAHLDSTRRASNAELYAICDVATDLLERMAEIHRPAKTFSDYDQMLADPALEAVVIATSDEFHVSLAERAVRAGKHVLVEKPMGVSVEECLALHAAVRESGIVLHVGFMKRYDPGIQSARRFVAEEMGELLSIRAWYCDSAYRYQVTDNLLPIPVHTDHAQRPAGDPKADRRRYYMLSHGSHLVDLARFIGGEITSISCQLVEKFGAYSWASTLTFASGAVGQLDLTIPVAMDWHEGFTIYGEHGSVTGRSYLPWYHRASDVDCFSLSSGRSTRALGADAHFYKLQIEGFASAVRGHTVEDAATVEDGLAATRAMVATATAARTGKDVRLDEVHGPV
jgi:predicted dehydrogenase